MTHTILQSRLAHREITALSLSDSTEHSIFSIRADSNTCRPHNVIKKDTKDQMLDILIPKSSDRMRIVLSERIAQKKNQIVWKSKEFKPITENVCSEESRL
jgi:hypothetical protein